MSIAIVPNTPSQTRSTFFTRGAACAFMALIGLGVLAWGYMSGGSNSPPLRWLLPGTQFLILAGLALVRRVPLRITIGAYMGGLLIITAVYYALWYDSLDYNGGGANIGLGILALAAIVLLPIPMLIGGFVGWLVPTRTTTASIGTDGEPK